MMPAVAHERRPEIVVLSDHNDHFRRLVESWYYSQSVLGIAPKKKKVVVSVTMEQAIDLTYEVQTDTLNLCFSSYLFIGLEEINRDEVIYLIYNIL